jgi:hypothetical protein
MRFLDGLGFVEVCDATRSVDGGSGADLDCTAETLVGAVSSCCGILVFCVVLSACSRALTDAS